jgi:hypothetical protein
MVNPFHLHNCGNSVDISELAFLRNTLGTRFAPFNQLFFNNLM